MEDWIWINGEFALIFPINATPPLPPPTIGDGTLVFNGNGFYVQPQDGPFFTDGSSFGHPLSSPMLMQSSPNPLRWTQVMDSIWSNVGDEMLNRDQNMVHDQPQQATPFTQASSHARVRYRHRHSHQHRHSHRLGPRNTLTNQRGARNTLVNRRGYPTSSYQYNTELWLAMMSMIANETDPFEFERDYQEIFDMEATTFQNQENEKGLSEECIAEILFKYKTNSKSEEEICVICQDEIQMEHEVIILSCGHFYHTDCIKEWLKIKNECAVCRALAFSIKE